MSSTQQLWAGLQQLTPTGDIMAMTKNVAARISHDRENQCRFGTLKDPQDEEEEVPVRRTVRMLVGLSESSLPSSQHQQNDDATSAAAMDPPIKRRQESATSTSTSSTERTSIHSQEGLAGDLSESHASLTGDVPVPSFDSIMENRSEVIVNLISASAEPRVNDDDEDEEDDLSGSGVFSLQRLYGREDEEETLFDAYTRIVRQTIPRQNLEYVLISGGVGTGKTALADALSRKVKSQGGFFCVGTFDQLGQRGPVQPMVDAFGQYVQQVFECGEDELKLARSRVRSMVDSKDLPSLMRIVPALRRLLGMEQQVESHAVDSTLSNPLHVSEEGEINDPSKKNYSHFAMMRLMRAISRPQRPVVMMLDDLQWAGSCCFEYLKSLVLDDMNDSFMFLGITRDNVDSTSAISRFLREIEDESVRITNIELDNFMPEVVQEMIDDSFAMSPEQARSLAEFLFQASCGNPFFVSSSIIMLQQEPRFLSYDKKAATWSLSEENAEAYMSSCPIHLVSKKLQVYPRDQQKVLMVVACLGSHSTQTMIEAALQEDATDPLKRLVHKGKLLYDDDEKTYTIRFNAVKTAAYNLIGEELQPAFHLEVGLRLMQYLTPEELEEKVFCVGMQLLHGISLLQDQEKKYGVAALFVRAAQKAAETFSFNASLWALRNAYDLLGPNHWDEAYELTMVIYNYLAEMEFALDDNERVDKLLEEIDDHGRNCADKRQSYLTRIHVLSVRGKPDLAIDKGICNLRCLGVKLHTDHRRLNLIWSMAKIGRKVRGKSNEMLRRLPEMTDQKQLTAMQVLNLLFLNTFLHRRELFPFVVLKMMKMSLQFGLSPMSAVAFAGYGTLLSFSGRGEEAQRFGKLALDLVERFTANSFRSRVYGLVYGCIQPAVQPWRNSIKKLMEGHELGLTTGDVEFAMFCAHLHIVFMMDDGGFTVETMIKEIRKCVDLTEAQGQSQLVNVSYRLCRMSGACVMFNLNRTSVIIALLDAPPLDCLGALH
jgi:predicted ATPase